MLGKSIRSAVALISLIALLAIQPVFGHAISASPVETATLLDRGSGNTDNEELSWFQWDDTVYAMADDGQAIWLGTAMGVLRWDKTTGAVERYTTIDGLPSTHVFAVAVDDAGNRWFGGDGGLSRLDAEGSWSHFSPDNSGLAEVLVDGIAAGADGTLWVSHGLPDGPVSRLASNGTWTAYPVVATTIAADYQAILATQSRNPLWLVSGDEVWMGFWVYDGASWHHRSPNAAGEKGSAGLPDVSAPRPKAIDADSSGAVWVMAESPEGTTSVLAWDDGVWTDHTPGFCIRVEMTTLAVAGDDTVWIGYSTLSRPPGPLAAYPGVMQLPTVTCLEPSYIDFRRPPAQVLLAAPEGVWAAGPGWLRLPSGAVIDLETLAYPEVTDVLADADDNLWVHSHEVFWEHALRGYAVQLLDDQQTSTTDDDQWKKWREQGGFYLNVLTGWDRLLGGDVIMTGYYDGRFGPDIGFPYRRHDDAWIVYEPDFNFGYNTNFYIDVFVQDNSHFWFAAQWGEPDIDRGVIGLDDRGTPLNPDDDIWATYRVGAGEPVTSVSPPEESAVAVNSLNRIWYADASGVNMLGGNGWERKLAIPACDLVPGRWGVVNVILPYAGTSCSELDMTVVIIDGSHIYSRELEDFAHVHAQYAPGSNRLWSVAPDGSVWYYWRPDNTVRRVVLSQQGVASYSLPADIGSVRSIQVGSGNRVWIVAHDNLWRLAPQPGFSVSGLSSWLLEPGASATHPGQVVAAGTWNWPVSLPRCGSAAGDLGQPATRPGSAR